MEQQSPDLNLSALSEGGQRAAVKWTADIGTQQVRKSDVGALGSETWLRGSEPFLWGETPELFSRFAFPGEDD